jgi:hypothetical protein
LLLNLRTHLLAITQGRGIRCEIGLEDRQFGRSPSELGEIDRMPLKQLIGALIKAVALDREFGAQLVTLRQNFLNRERNLHFQPASGQPVRPPPKGRRKCERCESCNKEPEREDHDLFDQALCSRGIFIGNYGTPARQDQNLLNPW